MARPEGFCTLCPVNRSSRVAATGTPRAPGEIVAGVAIHACGVGAGHDADRQEQPLYLESSRLLLGRQIQFVAPVWLEFLVKWRIQYSACHLYGRRSGMCNLAALAARV